MGNHKKFSDTSDEEDDDSKRKRKEKDSRKSENSDMDRKKAYDREKRRERKDRKNSENGDDLKNKEDENSEREAKRSHSTRRSPKHKSGRRDVDNYDDKHRSRSKEEKRRGRRCDRDEDESTDGPTWATNRVKENAAKIKERKLLWQGKKESDTQENNQAVPPIDQQVARNMGMWSSAIAATGVDNKQAEKFKKLLGFKGKATKEADEVTNLDAERVKQQSLLNSLDRQFSTARQITHNSRGMGLGYH